MKLRQFRKPIVIFCLFMVLAILFLFTFVKIRGEKLLLKDWHRQGFVFSAEMTISEFGRANQLKSPLLKKAFGLTAQEDFQKKLKDLDLTEKQIFNQVNKKLALQAKNETILIKWFNGAIQRLLHNFGLVTKDIQRSGQPNPPVLWLHYELFPFKTVINLAWEPEKSKDQVYERKFCEKRNIDYYKFSWNAGGPKDWRDVDRVIEIIDRCEKPVWIHCKGGKDRSGGLVALWKKKNGYPMGLIFRDFQTYEIPAFTWVQQLFCGKDVKPDDWLWCKRCHRCYKAFEFRKLKDKNGIFLHCHYKDCTGDLPLDSRRWNKLIKDKQGLPETPEKGKVYDLGLDSQHEE